jgi:glutaredoxin
VAFDEVDVAADVEGREELVRRTGQMAVPVIVVGDEVVVGFDRPRLAALLGLP